jgi:hypothetical protein
MIMSLYETISQISPYEKVKVTLNSGAYCLGTAKKVEKLMAKFLDYEVKSVNIIFLNRHLGLGLQREYDITL